MRAFSWSLVWLGLAAGCESRSPAAPADADVRDAQLDAGGVAHPSDAGVASGPADANRPDAQPDAALPALRVVLFSRTTGFRHGESIAAGQAVLQAWAHREPASLIATEDSAQLLAALPNTDVVVFLLTTGDVLNDTEQAAFEAFIRGGGGFVGIHSAADTEYDWPFYGELVGAWFDSHPALQPARIHVEAALHPSAAGLPETWERTDEWYNFRSNPRPNVDVVLTLDEMSYSGGTMGADHPIAWSHSVGQGRAFYTGLAHAADAWQEPLLCQHIENALRWAGGRTSR
jgi:type 1 glutamine amidotransferase